MAKVPVTIVILVAGVVLFYAALSKTAGTGTASLSEPTSVEGSVPPPPSQIVGGSVTVAATAEVIAEETLTPTVKPREDASSARKSPEDKQPATRRRKNHDSSAETAPSVWLRGNFARFNKEATNVRSHSQACKSYPVIGAMGVVCRVNHERQDESASAVVFSLQHRGLEIVRVMGNVAGEPESQYTSSTVDTKGTPPVQAADASKFTSSFKFEHHKKSRDDYEEVRVTLPPATLEGEALQLKQARRLLLGPAVYYFDIEVRDPKNVLKNASTCFITIGDWGNPQPFQSEVAKVMERVAIDNWARFIVSTGDNFYPMGVKNVNDIQFQTKYERVYNTLPGLRDLQWVLCAGNHDQWGIKGQLQYGSKNPQWWLPNRLFTKKVPVGVKSTAKLIIMDSSNRRNWKQQGAYLTKELIASTDAKEWKLVVNHEPVFCGSMHGMRPENKDIRKFWKPLLDANVANAYFNGDDHTLQVSRSNKTDYFVSGGGGGSTGYNATQLPENQWYSPTPVFGIMLHCISDNWGGSDTQDADNESDGGGGDIMTTKLFDGNGTLVYTHYTERRG